MATELNLNDHHSSSLANFPEKCYTYLDAAFREYQAIFVLEYLLFYEPRIKSTPLSIAALHSH
jgi:hypothetical protein